MIGLQLTASRGPSAVAERLFVNNEAALACKLFGLSI